MSSSSWKIAVSTLLLTIAWHGLPAVKIAMGSRVVDTTTVSKQRVAVSQEYPDTVAELAVLNTHTVLAYPPGIEPDADDVDLPQTAKSPSRSPTENSPERSANVETPVACAPIQNEQSTLLMEGTISYVDDVVLGAGRDGTITFLGVREGQIVRKGDRLVGIQDDVARAALARAEVLADNQLEIRNAEVTLELAQSQYAMARKLAEKDAIAEVELIQRRLDAEAAAVGVELARRELEVHRKVRDEATETLKTFRVIAPFDGVITKIYKHPGEVASAGEPVLVMCNRRRARIEGYVSLVNAVAMRPGTKVQVSLNPPHFVGDHRQWHGRVSFIEPRVQRVAGTVLIHVEIDNSESFTLDGLTATVCVPGTTKPSQKLAMQ